MEKEGGDCWRVTAPFRLDISALHTARMGELRRVDAPPGPPAPRPFIHICVGSNRKFRA